MRVRVPRRWKARLALLAGAAAMVVLLLFAGLRGFALVGVGLAGLAATAAGVWWVLAHGGLVRAFALLLVVAAPVTVLLVYAFAGLLWVVLVSMALWAVAVSVGRDALVQEAAPAGFAERRAEPPRRPFLIMNPRSGGGKVGRFRLRERAEELGAEVVVLDPAHPQDVAELARRGIGAGADLIGVAGGDGTQALVAEVAAEHDVPFVVISAGTRNHFAMDLGLDRDDPSTCLEALTDGVEIRVDLGFVGGRVFVNNASFGAYAAVVQSPEYRDDKVRTTLRTLPELLTHHSGPRLTVRTADLTVEGPQAVLVSNNAYSGGDPAGLGRRERLDAGTLGVLSVKVDNAAQAAGLLRGRRGPGLVSFLAPEVVVAADAPVVQVGVDGEALTMPTPVRCRTAPGALRVVVPRHRPGQPRGRPPMSWRSLGQLAMAPGRPAGDDDGPGEPAADVAAARATGATSASVRGEPAGDGAGREGGGPDRGHGSWQLSATREARVDYSGAVYGSMLAASVVVGAGTLGEFPRLQMAALLLCTGVVFWAAHVFARLFGASLMDESLTWRAVGTVCKHERPIIDAAVPPAAAAALSPLLGLGAGETLWLALGVALAGQVGWATAGAVRVGADRRLVAVAAAVNLLLGLLIVLAKVALTH